MNVIVIPDGYSIAEVTGGHCKECIFSVYEPDSEDKMTHYCGFKCTIKPPCVDTVYQIVPDDVD